MNEAHVHSSLPRANSIRNMIVGIIYLCGNRSNLRYAHDILNVAAACFQYSLLRIILLYWMMRKMFDISPISHTHFDTKMTEEQYHYRYSAEKSSVSSKYISKSTSRHPTPIPKPTRLREKVREWMRWHVIHSHYHYSYYYWYDIYISSYFMLSPKLSHPISIKI